MGLMDSLQGFFIVVGGVQVPGIMQSLLMQGAVPVTMLCSILLLRYRGCSTCKEVRSLLEKNKIHFTERSTQPLLECGGENGCVCRVEIGNGTTFYSVRPKAW